MLDTITGTFDGQNMVTESGKVYPIPENYISKSKLVEGDELKLDIHDDGKFIYKQILPVERKTVMGVVIPSQGTLRVSANSREYKIIHAALTFFKVKVGDRVMVLIPKERDATWAALDNIVSYAGEDVEL